MKFTVLEPLLARPRRGLSTTFVVQVHGTYRLVTV